MKELIQYVIEQKKYLENIPNAFELIEHLRNQGFNLTICPDDSNTRHTGKYDRESGNCKCGCSGDGSAWTKTLILDGKYNIYENSGCSCSQMLIDDGTLNGNRWLANKIIDNILGEYKPHDCIMWTEKEIKELEEKEFKEKEDTKSPEQKFLEKKFNAEVYLPSNKEYIKIYTKNDEHLKSVLNNLGFSKENK